jgi:1-acyl-sn-glycerol-3-phosphate acyltransferase
LHKPKAGFWIRACVALLYPIDTVLFRMKWRHLDRIPHQGGVIIAINHNSQVDTVLMARLVWQSGRVPRFMIKASLFSKPFLGKIFTGSQQIPVYRGTADAAKSLRAAITALDEGEAVVIYPEGTVTYDPDQWPMQAKTGMARLVMLRPDIPVIPIGQWGAQKRLQGRFRLRRVSLASVGQPLDLSRFRGAPRTATTFREITDTVMSAVRDEVALLRGEPAPTEFYRPPAPTEADGAPRVRRAGRA